MPTRFYISITVCISEEVRNEYQTGMDLVEMLPFLGGDIPVAEFGMPGSCEVGENAAAVMKNRNGVLLKNHGVVAVGKQPEQAYLRAVYIEDAAKICALASMCGAPQVLEQNIERKLMEGVPMMVTILAAACPPASTEAISSFKSQYYFVPNIRFPASPKPGQIYTPELPHDLHGGYTSLPLRNAATALPY